MINTVLVEDNLYVQKVLKAMIESDERFRLTATFTDAFEAEKLCADGKTDLVLMDVQTQNNHSGLAAGKRIKEASPRTKVVIVTSLVDPDILKKARNGAADSLWYCDTEFEMETLASYDNELKNEPAENMTWNDVAGAEWQDRETEGLLSYCRVSTDAEDQINSYRAQVSYYRQKHLVLSNIIDCSIPSRRHIEKAL